MGDISHASTVKLSLRARLVVLHRVIFIVMVVKLHQYNTIRYKTYNAPYVTKMLFVGASHNQTSAMNTFGRKCHICGSKYHLKGACNKVTEKGKRPMQLLFCTAAATRIRQVDGQQQRHHRTCPSIVYKKLSYRRETALQPV